MENLTVGQIERIRKQGFRPQVVACFLNNKKILFLFKKEHDLWQLPQGGIDNKETIEQAFGREMAEELGNKFTASCNKDLILFGEDKVKFPQTTQNKRNLQNNQGENIFMKGKKYFFVAATTTNSKININDTEFDGLKWINYNDALILAGNMRQQGKKRITINILNSLKELKLL